MNIGDVVYLASGSDKMTIVEFKKDERGERVVTNWMDNRQQIVSGDFPVSAIVVDKPA